MPHHTRETLLLKSLVTSDDLVRLQSYTRRGRGFEVTGDTELIGTWCQGMRAWAQDPDTRPSALDDAEAELSLRGLEPPLDLVSGEIAAVIEGAMKILAATDFGRRSAATGDVMAAAKADRRRPN